MKICKKCKIELDDNAEVCENCGSVEFEEYSDNYQIDSSNYENDASQQELKSNNETIFKGFMRNLAAMISSRKAFVMIGGSFLLCVLACIYFGIQISAFGNNSSIYGVCIIIEVIFCILACFCLILFVASIVLNIKEIKQERQQGQTQQTQDDLSEDEKNQNKREM